MAPLSAITSTSSSDCIGGIVKDSDHLGDGETWGGVRRHGEVCGEVARHGEVCGEIGVRWEVCGGIVMD